MKGMIPDLEPVKGAPIDVAWAEQLKSIITKAGIPTRHAKLAFWADQFRQLRQSVTDYTRIEDALDWYSTNIAKRYTPVVNCAKSFRQKFANIEAAMKRHAGNGTVPSEVSQEAKDVAKRLRRLGWVNGTDKQLEATVQSTMNGFRDFKAKVKEKVKAAGYTTSYRHLADFLNYVFQKIRFTPEDFAEQWLARIHRQYGHWDDWRGDLLSQAFRPDNKTFTKWGHSWAADFGCKASLWDDLMELING